MIRRTALEAKSYDKGGNEGYSGKASFVSGAIGIGLLASLAIIGIRAAGGLEAVELQTYDWTLRLRPFATEADPRILLITITEEDIRKLGRWPLSDESVAKVLKILTDAGARTIGLDIYRDIEVPPGREALNTLLASHREIITVMKFPDQNGREIPGPAILQETDQIAFNDILIDPGGTVRRGFLFLEYQDRIATSFAFSLALRYLEPEGIVARPDPTNPAFLRLGNITIPPLTSNDGGYASADTRGYQFLLKYRGGPSPFTTFTLTDLLTEKVSADAIEGRAVLVGMVAESVRDSFFTPYSRGLNGEQQISGIELHAHMVRQFLEIALNNAQLMQSFPEEVEWGWILCWGVVGGLFGLMVPTPWRFIVFIMSGVAILAGIGFLALINSWWIPVVPPVLAWALAGSLMTAWGVNQERRERKLLMGLFGRHVDEEIAETIWQHRHQILQGGRIPAQHHTVTVLFADLEGFTAIAEQVAPHDLMNWLNNYMEVMAEVVRQYKGIIDDYYGDGIKVNFGVPFPRTTKEAIQQDAVSAVKCGLAIKDKLARLNKARGQTVFPSVRVRIGIATGPVVSGSLGGRDRLKYTTVGDTVNVAARLEQLGKESRTGLMESHGGTLLIAEGTHQYLDETWNTKIIGEFRLRGKKEGVVVYHVLDRSG